jgi:hypothetical protein
MHDYQISGSLRCTGSYRVLPVEYGITGGLYHALTYGECDRPSEPPPLQGLSIESDSSAC